MANPRVIFVNRVYWPNESATAQLLTDLAEALAARQWDVHVICSGPGAGVESQQGVTVHRSGMPSDHAGMRRRAVGYGHFLGFARRKLRTLVKDQDVVVVKTDPPMLAAAVTSVAVARGARVVQWIQDIYPEIALQHGGRWMSPLLSPLRFARDRAWRNSAACVPVGEDMATLVAAHGIPATRIHVLPNWAPRELDPLAAPELVAAQRATWGWQDKFVVAYSGNLGRVHEFRTLLDSARRLRERPDVRFAFIGSGARLGEVRRAAESEGLSNVQFAPPQPRERLAATLAAADVHVVTLLPGFESLVHPSKVSGALAVGRPIAFIGPAQCALAKFLRQTRAGTAFAPGADEALASTLREWQANAVTRQKIGAAARAAYEAHLRFSNLLPRWEALLAEAARTTLPTQTTRG